MDTIIFGGASEDDKRRVLELVYDLENLLMQIVEGQECDFIFYKDLLPNMKMAWSTVSERFEELKYKTEEVSLEKLIDHGLTGKELNFKISVINFTAQQFYYHLSERVYPLVNRWLKKLLEALDTFLTSLLDAVGGKGAIGEFKAFMESSIDDGV